ncbi:MAG: hybrid sensor histidine kinase/response regulator [Fibrobacteres bacterium]|nr:hybrid sensor histidine kinase/response regulator [Fibrobacterota bacterium]
MTRFPSGTSKSIPDTETQFDEIGKLHSLSLKLSTYTDQAQILQEVLSHALSVYRTQKGILSLAAPDGGGLKVGASLGMSAGYLKAFETVPEGSGAFLATGRPVIVEDVESDPLFGAHLEAARQEGFRSVHSVPLISRQGKVIGVLSAYFPEPRQAVEREARFADLFARLGADSIEQEELRAIANRESDQRLLAEGKMREYSETLEVLNRTSTQLVAEHDLEKIVQAVTDGGREVSHASFGAFFYNTTNEQGDSFMLYTLSGVPREAFAHFPMPRKTELFAHTFEGKGPQRFDDVTKRPEYGKSAPHHGMPKGHLAVRSYMSVPVISRTGEVLGGLFYGHPEPGIFTETSERLLVNLASQAAVAIDNSKLYAKLHEDLAKRRKAEAAAQKFAAIVNSSGDAIISKDVNAIITSWNKSAERIFGYKEDEAIGRPITILIPDNHIDEEPRILERILRGETISHYETVRRRKDGSIINISLTVSPIFDEDGKIIGASKIARDVTDLKETEEQLRQAQKMEAVGRLAGGIAHDFNNLLTSIIGFTEMAQTLAGADATLAEYLDEVRKSGQRAATLTQQLLAYSRKQVLSPKVIDLNAIVAEMERMLSRLIGEDIAFTTVLEPDLGSVKADPSQIQQIIVNLVLNARDAMPNGGKLVIRSQTVFVDRESAAGSDEAAREPFAMLSVSDTGVGMTEEVQARIFEPFYTTKEVGKGTGLGLSSVYGIVSQSGGSISVISEPGHGAMFKVFFPIVEGIHRKESQVLPPQASAKSLRGETILLAEDESAVRKFLVATLRANGYAVLEAADGPQAMEIGLRTPQIDLLLTDVVMPGMNGGGLAEGLKANHEGLKVLFMSGYTKDILSPNSLKDKNTRFLQKPFTQADLLAKIRDMLAKPA